MSAEQRAIATSAFARRFEIPAIVRVVQRGRDPELARYTLELADGREVRIGTIKTLWSQTEFGKVLAVAIGAVPFSVEPNEWRAAVRMLITHATDVQELEGETFEDQVAEWAARYGARASHDASGAAAGQQPFLGEHDRLHVHAGDLTRWIKREWLETGVTQHSVRQALADLGWERTTIYYRSGGSGGKVEGGRTSASYYRAPAAP